MNPSRTALPLQRRTTWNERQVSVSVHCSGKRVKLTRTHIHLVPLSSLFSFFFVGAKFTEGVEAGRVVQVIARLGEAVGEIGLAGGQVREGRGRAEMPPLSIYIYIGGPCLEARQCFPQNQNKCKILTFRSCTKYQVYI